MDTPKIKYAKWKTNSMVWVLCRISMNKWTNIFWVLGTENRLVVWSKIENLKVGECENSKWDKDQLYGGECKLDVSGDHNAVCRNVNLKAI